MYEHIILEKADQIGRIIFNYPERYNPLTPEVMKEVIIAMEDLNDDEHIRVIVFSGKGKGFSSGGDYAFLETAATMKASEIKYAVYHYFAGAAKAVKLSPKPTIAAVRGPAVGAGCELAILCDFRIVSETAMFKQAWVKLGLISPLGGMYLLPRLIGLSKASQMFMMGKEVHGKEAERIGLADKCVPDDQLEAETDAWAAELAQGAPLAIKAIKEGLRRGMETSIYSEWETNSFVQATLLTTQDYKEAVTAIKEKRAPRFTGR